MSFTAVTHSTCHVTMYMRVISLSIAMWSLASWLAVSSWIIFCKLYRQTPGVCVHASDKIVMCAMRQSGLGSAHIWTVPVCVLQVAKSPGSHQGLLTEPVALAHAIDKAANF